MRKPTLVLYQGAGFDSQSPRRFVKDILRVGRWIHPITKQVVEVTPERIRNLVRNTEEYRQTLDRKAVPFQDGHNFEAKKTLGYWNRFWFQGDRLYGEVEVTDNEAAKKITEGSIRSVSARIEPLSDTNGKDYDEAFSHVCATPLAVVDGQGNFEQLSREDDSIDLLIPTELAGTVPGGDKSLSRKEGSMDPKKLAVLLGLPETATPEQIEEATKKAAAAQKTQLDRSKEDQERATQLSADLKAHGFELKDGKVVKLSAAPPADETPREKDLRERAERAERIANLSRLQAVKKDIEAACGEQVIPPALVPAFTELASIESDVQALCLSSDGATLQKKGVNALGRVMEIIKGLPKLNEQSLQQLSAAAADEQGKIQKSAKTKAAEVLARTTGGEVDKD